MKATAHNTIRECEGCGTRRNYVMAVAFERDGTAMFRFLCASCERRERPLNQPALFESATYATVEEAEEAVEELLPLRDERQMGLFTFNESEGY